MFIASEVFNFEKNGDKHSCTFVFKASNHKVSLNCYRINDEYQNIDKIDINDVNIVESKKSFIDSFIEKTKNDLGSNDDDVNEVLDNFKEQLINND